MQTVLRDRFQKAYDLSETQLVKLADFSTLLMQWSPKIDLISPCSEAEFLDRHLEDSLRSLSIVRREFSGLETKKLLDVGSGAGLPGMIWAIVSEGTEITLLEPREKRVVFLKEARRRLNLPRLHIQQGRFEDLPQKPEMDLICCRALGSRAFFLQTAISRLLPGGAAIELLGSDSWSANAELEAGALQAGFHAFDLVAYQEDPPAGPETSDGRCLAISRVSRET